MFWMLAWYQQLDTTVKWFSMFLKVQEIWHFFYFVLRLHYLNGFRNTTGCEVKADPDLDFGLIQGRAEQSVRLELQELNVLVAQHSPDLLERRQD